MFAQFVISSTARTYLIFLQIQWHAFPATTLHSYRHAHHLQTPSAYNNPHVDLILASSQTGLRSPSSVVARRKIRDAKHRVRQKDAAAAESSKHKDRERSSDRLKGITASNVHNTNALD